MSNDYYLYLRCVSARWSSSYYYGSSNWRGQVKLNDETQTLYDKIKITAVQIKTKLDSLYTVPEYYIEDSEEELNQIFKELSDYWSGNSYIESKSISYSNADKLSNIPKNYYCDVCHSTDEAAAKFKTEVSNFFGPFSINCTQAVIQTYRDYLDPLDSILSIFQLQYEGIKNITREYKIYDSKNMPIMDNVISTQLTQIQSIFFGYNISLLGIFVVLLVVQAFSSFMVTRKYYKWRRSLNIGWCAHSCLMVTCKR